MPVALVTGAGGFCGRHLIRRLKREDPLRESLHIVGAVRGIAEPGQLDVDQHVFMDMTDPEQVLQVVKRVKPDMVFHLAGLIDGTQEALYRTNLLGTVYLLEALRIHASGARILLVGSASEYGYIPEQDLPVTEDYPCNPRSPRAVSKYLATRVALDYAHRLGMKVVVARPFNIIGAGVPRTLLVGAVLDRIKQAIRSNASVIKIGNLDSQRDFVAVEDVVEAFLTMIQGEYWGEVYNICSGRPYPIRNVVMWLLSRAPGHIEPQVDQTLISPTDDQIVYGSPEKARQTFGFITSVSLEEALEAAWDHAMDGVF